MSEPPTPGSVEVEFISPRHLAGGGDPAWITVPLHRACGWSHGNDPLMPRVILSSPDQKALLRLEPDPDGQWWTLHHSACSDQPAWYASFGARTPVEIIAGFLDELTNPTATTVVEPYEPLRQADWTPTNMGAPGLMSPDRMLMLQRLDEGAWFATVHVGEHRPVWQAHFGPHTPAHLISAFAAALVDPDPVLRTGSPRSLPTRNPNLVTRAIRDVPAVQVASALEERVVALAGRGRTFPSTGPTVVRWPPPATGRTH